MTAYDLRSKIKPDMTNGYLPPANVYFSIKSFWTTNAEGLIGVIHSLDYTLNEFGGAIDF